MKIRFASLFSIALVLCLACGGSDSDPIPEISAVSGIQLFDINNRGNASDIRLFFNSNASLTDLAEFRIIIVPENEAGTLSMADFSVGGSGVLVQTADRGQIRLTFDAGQTDFQGNTIVNDVAYRVAVASIHQQAEGISPIVTSSTSLTLTDRPLRDLYVSNSKGNSVVVIDEVTGELIGNFVSPGSGGLNDTQEMIINDNGDFLVTGFGNTALKLYSGTNGQFIRDFTSGYRLGQPAKTAIGPDGLIYVSQWRNNINNVARFNYETGDFVDEYVTGIDRAMGHAWDDDGNYYLASFGTPSVIKYNSEGSRVGTIGAGDLQGPVNVWVNNQQKRLYVVDWPVGRVKRYDLESGNFVDDFITGLQRVEGFLFGSNGALYLCDWQTNAVNEYDASTGVLRRSIPISILNNPNGIVYGPNRDPGDL